MKILVVGASGATGMQLVEQLLNKQHKVKAIVRSPEKLPAPWHNHQNLSIIKAEISEISGAEMAAIVKDCDAVASCLGHNLTFKGMYGKPRKLVTDAVQQICKAILENKPDQPVKFVLMNTSGNRNRDLDEPISVGEKLVVGLIRLLVPPHVDNEQAAGFLSREIGKENKYIEWAAVRPDSLIDEKEVTNYEIYPSPIRSAIFNAGKTSRINVGHFMAELIGDNTLWNEWKGQMPVIYNKESK